MILQQHSSSHVVQRSVVKTRPERKTMVRFERYLINKRKYRKVDGLSSSPGVISLVFASYLHDHYFVEFIRADRKFGASPSESKLATKVYTAIPKVWKL